MVESFYLSNVVPQNLENNAGFWNRFEIYCRDLTKKYSSVYIISGPLVLPQSDESGKKFVKYPVGFLCSYSPFLHCHLVSSLQKINIGNTGNQNHTDLKVRVLTSRSGWLLVTCISNIDYF